MKTIVLLLLAAAAISITGSTGIAFAEEGASGHLVLQQVEQE